MQIICRCGEPIKKRRSFLGYKTCTKCGELEAQIEIEAKKLRTAPQGNKQGLAYMGSGEAARKNLLDATDNRRITANVVIRTSYTTKTRQVHTRRKPVGVVYFGTEINGEIIYDLEDKRLKTCSRHVLF